MTDLKTQEQGDKLSAQKADQPALENKEGQQARNASGEQVSAIKATNPNASDGSVNNWAKKTLAEKFAQAELDGQDKSFELITTTPGGPEKVLASRQLAASAQGKVDCLPKQADLVAEDNRPIKNYDWQETEHEKHTVIKTGLVYEAETSAVTTEQTLFDSIGKLPLDQQAQVIGAGIKAFSNELSLEQFRIGVGAITGLGEGVVGLAQNAETLGKTVLDVAQFNRDIMCNDPAAVGTAGKAGESVGKLMVSGIRIFSAAEDYLESVGAASNGGDCGKPLRDVAWLGLQLNNRWEKLSPEEKTRLSTKLAVETFGGATFGAGALKLAKSVKITEALEVLGAEASTLGEATKEKAQNLISRMADELAPQSGSTMNGFDMPIPKQQLKNDANMLMSKAEDFDGHSPNKPFKLPEGDENLTSHASEAREANDYFSKRVTQEDLGLKSSFELFQVFKSMKNGTQTVFVEMVRNPPELRGEANFSELMEALKRNARAEGAKILRLECEFKTRDLKKFGKPAISQKRSAANTSQKENSKLRKLNMPPTLEDRVKKCFGDTRLFRITTHVSVDLKLEPEERILGVYFNAALDDYSEGFILSSKGIHILSAPDKRFIPYNSIASSDMHMNKQDQARDYKYRYVELILESGERVKISMVGEYENGTLDFYNLDRYIGYVYRDEKMRNEKQMA
ncbi:MAG: hypothetical protein KGS72_03240 [Cyanobacteria bacterium REEB67]|nr:hypothetical protein [Cyanobacteria bacterium REEB67]